MSRQREWQLRKKAEGKCQGCGKPRNCESVSYCKKCLVVKRQQNRKKLGFKKWAGFGKTGRVPFCHDWDV